jgi:hypothetical protein
MFDIQMLRIYFYFKIVPFQIQHFGCQTIILFSNNHLGNKRNNLGKNIVNERNFFGRFHGPLGQLAH